MNPETDHDTFSIQIKISGRSVVSRNALIGSVVSAMLLTAALTYGEPRFFVMLLPLFAGLIAGGIPAGMAWLGQVIAAKRGEGDRYINWAAIKYTGLIPALLGVCGITAALIDRNSPLGAIAGSAIAMIAGALLAGFITVVASTIGRMVRRHPTVAMLNERQFDPLQHIESREHARR